MENEIKNIINSEIRNILKEIYYPGQTWESISSAKRALSRAIEILEMAQEAIEAEEDIDMENIYNYAAELMELVYSTEFKYFEDNNGEITLSKSSNSSS